MRHRLVTIHHCAATDWSLRIDRCVGSSSIHIDADIIAERKAIHHPERPRHRRTCFTSRIPAILGKARLAQRVLYERACTSEREKRRPFQSSDVNDVTTSPD